MSVTKRDLPEIHVRRETKYGIDSNPAGINYNHVPEEYLLSLSDDSGKLMNLGTILNDSRNDYVSPLTIEDCTRSKKQSWNCFPFQLQLRAELQLLLVPVPNGN